MPHEVKELTPVISRVHSVFASGQPGGTRIERQQQASSVRVLPDQGICLA
jgi:hypothetical protein